MLFPLELLLLLLFFFISLFFSLLIIFYAKSFLTLMKPQSVMFKSMQIKCCCCFFVCWYLSSNLLDCLHISNCLFVQSFSCSMCVFGFDFFFSFSLSFSGRTKCFHLLLTKKTSLSVNLFNSHSGKSIDFFNSV